MQRRSLWSIVMLVILLLSLSACGGSEPAPDAVSSTGASMGASTGTTTQGGVSAPAAGQAPAYGETVEVPGGSYQVISPEDLDDMLAGEGLTLINVEPRYEAEIEGTDLYIPHLEIPQNLGKIADREAIIVLYSADGEFSKKGAEKLVSFGYSGIYDLDGGMEAWEAAGLPLLPAGE